MCAVLLLPTLGLAQPTMRVAAPFEDYCEYSAVRDVLLGQVFDIVVVLDSDGQDVSTAAFNLTPLPPGVFTFNAEYPTSSTVNHGDAAAGEYDLELLGCAPPCDQRELVRFQALDTTGALRSGSNFIMVVSGLGDSADDPVFRSCDGVEHAAPMGGADGGIVAPGVEFPDGSLILSPTPISRPGRLHAPPCDLRSQCLQAVPVSTGSMATLKARFR
jgi:hypothetical protein